MSKLNFTFFFLLILLALVSLPTLNYAQEQGTSRFIDPEKPLYNEIESDEIVSEKGTFDKLDEKKKPIRRNSTQKSYGKM